MTNQQQNRNINEARALAKELYDLLHDDALHRLRLYQKYSYDVDDSKWSPNLYQRCQLIEALCRKLG